MRSPRAAALTVCILLFLSLFAQTLAHARAASITFDEGPHLAIGYATLRTGDFRLQPVHIHPPLANILAAAPLLLQDDLPDPRDISGWEIASLSAVTDAVVWQYPYPRRLALAARSPIIALTLLLGAIVFRWASDLGGEWAGLLALFLYAFDPNIIAHGSLVTTDMAVVLWGTAALFLTARYLQCPRWQHLVGTGVTLGLALASKVSALTLLPSLGVLWLLGPRSFPWRRRLLTAAGCLALAGLILWAAYGFEARSLPGFPLPLPAATHLEIYRSLQTHYRLGHPSFLMGRNSDRGWWYYFPVAFALKTPLPTLLLLLASAFRVASCKPQVARCGAATRRWGPLILFPILYTLSAFFVWLSYFTFHVSRFTLRVSHLAFHVSRFTFYLLLLWLALATLHLSPHYLTYFNPLVGGPAEGYRYLVDSNLDWGQNLWQLRDWMRDNGVERVYYAHFSPARPAVYGVEADFLPPDPRAVDFVPFDPSPGIYVIGATVLQGVYTPDVNTYAWFRSHEPMVRLGHALFIYRVSPRPAPEWVGVCAAPTPVLAPEEVRSLFGDADLRVVLADCGQSWVYPTGVGGYVMPPEAEPPQGATLEIRARRADGSPSYTVYRLAGKAPLPPQTMAMKMDGPLDLLGYALSPATAHPGDVVTLQTWWRVKRIPDRPLSLMAHLTDVGGEIIAVGDGLGFPAEQWAGGDIFVQRHRLTVPEDARPDEYSIYTGAYWLDTMERWVGYSGSAYFDRIPLAYVTVASR